MNLLLPENSQSFWLQTPATTYPELNQTHEVDVAIVGGGIAGLTIAYKLKKTGLKVAVIEKNTLASGTTGGTTGKVTSQHGLIYIDLLKHHGAAKTKLYADAFQKAFAQTEALIKNEKIDCDWQREDNFVYTANNAKKQSFQEEARVAARFGLPSSFESKVDLPFKVTGAVKFADQARFNANKYTHALAQLVQGDRCFVFENSNVHKIKEGNPGVVSTDKGTVMAKHIVVATKIPPGPMMARVTYGIVEYPQTSYIVAGKSNVRLKGMYISPDKNHYSILPIESSEDSLMLIGGENHIPGLGNFWHRQKKLAEYANRWFGVEKIDFRWKAMDYIAYDKLPLIGKMYPWSKNLYAVTGFKKWGLSTSMVAANVICDLVQGQTTAITELFYPHRLSAPVSLPRTAWEYITR